MEDLVLAAAATGLPGSLRTLPSQEVSIEDALVLVAAAERHGIAGMVLAAVQRGELLLPAEALDALVETHARQMDTCLRLEDGLLSVTALLEGTGIETRVLAGTAVAHLDYPDPALRAFHRLDLLVRAADLQGAAEILCRRGWLRSGLQEPGARHEIVLVSPAGLALELQATLPDVPADVRINVSDFWNESQEFHLGGRRLRALGAEQRLLHISCCAVRDDATSLVAQRDLVEIALFGTWVFSHLVALASSWNAHLVLARAIRAAWQRLAIADVIALSVWADSYRTTSGRPQPRRESGTGAPRVVPPRPWRELRNLRIGRS
jgi:hypothetical protein